MEYRTLLALLSLSLVSSASPLMPIEVEPLHHHHHHHHLHNGTFNGTRHEKHACHGKFVWDERSNPHCIERQDLAKGNGAGPSSPLVTPTTTSSMSSETTAGGFSKRAPYMMCVSRNHCNFTCKFAKSATEKHRLPHCGQVPR
jgi:hypothetical protein